MIPVFKMGVVRQPWGGLVWGLFWVCVVCVLGSCLHSCYSLITGVLKFFQRVSCNCRCGSHGSVVTFSVVFIFLHVCIIDIIMCCLGCLFKTLHILWRA